MALTPYACTNCGFWQRHFTVPPGCPICEDHRHVLPDDGFHMLTVDEVESRSQVVWDEPEPGVWRFRMTEPIGIGPMGYVIEHPEGNVAFEGCGWYSDAALEHIASLGGLRAAIASHPHCYGALWRLVDAFAPEVPLHVGDPGGRRRSR